MIPLPPMHLGQYGMEGQIVRQIPHQRQNQRQRGGGTVRLHHRHRSKVALAPDFNPSPPLNARFSFRTAVKAKYSCISFSNFGVPQAGSSAGSV